MTDNDNTTKGKRIVTNHMLLAEENPNLPKLVSDFRNSGLRYGFLTDFSSLEEHPEGGWVLGIRVQKL